MKLFFLMFLDDFNVIIKKKSKNNYNIKQTLNEKIYSLPRLLSLTGVYLKLFEKKFLS
jgi:hypothetical protein